MSACVSITNRSDGSTNRNGFARGEYQVLEQLSRRRLLQGSVRAERSPLRPPWADTESVFVERCTRCQQCLQQCPQHIIVTGDGGFPEVNLRRGECTFCGECVRACNDAALIPLAAWTEPAPWTVRAVIGRTCFSFNGIACRVCADHCVARAIRFFALRGGAFVPRLDVSRCTGCGACISACPADAISAEAHSDGQSAQQHDFSKRAAASGP